MTREEILALDLKHGERIWVEVDVNLVDTEGRIMTLKIGNGQDTYWMHNENIHSIRRVEQTEIGCEQPTVESYYISLADFNNQKAYERRIYAFQVAREFAEKGEEMPDDLRNEIMTYISKSPEIEQPTKESPEEKIEVTEVEGVDYVLNIDGNQIRVGDKCERVAVPYKELEGILTIHKIYSRLSILVSNSTNLWDPSNFRKVN